MQGSRHNLFTSKLVEGNATHIFETKQIFSQITAVTPSVQHINLNQNYCYSLTSFGILKNIVSTNNILYG